MDAAAERNPFAAIAGPSRTRLFRLFPVAILAFTFAAPAATASGGSRQRPPDLQPLWQGYPLDPGAGRVETRNKPTTPARAKTQRPPESASESRPKDGGRPVLLRIAAAGGALLVVVLAALLVFRSALIPPRLTKGARMPRFMNRRSRQEPAADSPATDDDIAARLASYGAAAEAPTAEPEQAEPEAQATEPEAEPAESEAEVPAPTDTANIAAHVHSVLKAAEDAAARVLEEARAKAAEIRGGAERERASRIEAAEAEAARLREEAEREHGAALASAAAARAEAEEQAETIRAEAERAASSFETTASSRYEQLLKDTAFAEERLRRLVRGLREAADHLDSLLGPRGGQAEEEPDVDAEESSLVDALEPHGSTADVGR
jgi:hypothetical protein